MQVAIIGTGTMGRRLAVDFARAGHMISLYDARPAAVDEALQWCCEVADLWEREGKLHQTTAAELGRRLASRSPLAAALDGAELIFENVPERLEVKQVCASSRRGSPPQRTSTGPGCLIGRSRSAPVHSWIASGSM